LNALRFRKSSLGGATSITREAQTMTSKRPAILMAILLVFVLAYVSNPFWHGYVFGPQGLTAEPPLPGQSSVSGLAVHREVDGRWVATHDYFYTGEPQWAYLSINLAGDTSTNVDLNSAGIIPRAYIAQAQRGSHHISFEVPRPSVTDSAITRQVVVQLLRADGKEITSQAVAQIINWPDLQTWTLDRELASKKPDEVFKRAVTLIDVGGQSELDEAKRILERLIAKDAQFGPGYVELARIAMKSNWGPEGRHQAENLLVSALQINPGNANAKILLGYVYSHQKRFKESEALFAEAEQSGTNNLWLWANWGGLLEMQGKFDQSEQKYREAVTRPRTNDTYDRARLDAYANLLFLLERRKDYDAMEALLKQRTDESGPGSCNSTEYARFLLRQRGDSTAAIVLARQALDANCGTPAREVLGLAHYMEWADATGPQRNASLDQARIFLPAGPRLLYLLATSDRTVKAAQMLLAAGESIEQLDNRRFNALAYALEQKDVAAA
jgi:Tfp pilus assembly protein PilF